MSTLLVLLGGLVGAPARFLLDLGLSRRVGSRFPVGTLVINLTGSALLGALSGLSRAGKLDAEVLALTGTGFCGAFTTASTFAWESVELVALGRGRAFCLYVLGSVLGGLVLAGATYWGVHSAVG